VRLARSLRIVFVVSWNVLARHVIEVLVLTSVDGAPARAVDVIARADQPVTLHAAVRVRDPGQRCVLYTDAPKPRTRCRVRPAPKGVEARWSKLEAEKPYYDNVPNGRFTVASIRLEAHAWRHGPWNLPADVRPLRRAGLPSGGTMRYAVRVTLPDGTDRASPTPLDAYAGGVPSKLDARRVTLRASDDYLGYLTELGGIPYVFGSSPIGSEIHQAERGVGVDCADLMIYGLRRMGHDLKYVSSRTLGPYSRPVVGPVRARRGKVYLDASGEPVRVGKKGVRPGDWIIWDGHVGAFHTDRGTLGVLDSDDLVIHTAWAEVAIQSFEDSGYADRGFSVRRARALDQ
jgi:hypothetical protein